MRRFDNIDDEVESVNRWEERKDSQVHYHKPVIGKVFIGKVGQVFPKINVVAIRLNGQLSVGDIIEIGNEEEAIRQRVESMQINGKNIIIANEGDEVGIKLKYSVPENSDVYRINLHKTN
jgi:translation initiation factor IF-2